MTDAIAYILRSLIHSYDGRIVLDIPHCDIPSGQICAFTGANGCGKTTILSILGLLLAPSSGSVLLHGTEAAGSRDPRLRRKVTLVHQRPVLFAASVRNNIAYGLRAQGFPAKEVRNRVRAIMEEIGLGAESEKQARKLSGGEAQRVVLARALVLETPIVLLDEPTNSLDDAFRPVLAGLLRRANQKRGATIIIATHDLGFVSSLAARIVPLEQGKISESL